MLREPICQMLLSRWEKTLNDFRDCPAMMGRGSFLRFSDLADALDQQPPANSPVFACGAPVDIAVATLRAWRDHQPLLPLEKVDLTAELPAEARAYAHLKRVPGSDQADQFVAFYSGQIAADADRIVTAMELSPATPNVAAISLAHSYGYSSILLPMLLHGIPIQLVEIPFPAAVNEAMMAHDQVVLPAVPSMWQAWHRAKILDTSRIRLAVSAGAPLHLDLERAIWASDRLKLHNFYGASECGGISYDTRSTPRESDHSLGYPLDGVEVTVRGNQTFVVRSSSVGVGYLRPNNALQEGSFMTSDRGCIKNGELIFHSFAGDVINVAGRKISPARIEAMIRQAGSLDSVRVFGIASKQPERVDDVAALVPLGTDVAQIQQQLTNLLEGWEIPRHWIMANDASLWTRSRGELRDHFDSSRDRS